MSDTPARPDEAIERLTDFFHERTMSPGPREDGIDVLAYVEALEKRIAELESRPLEIEWAPFIPPAVVEALEFYAEEWYDAGDDDGTIPTAELVDDMGSAARAALAEARRGWVAEEWWFYPETGNWLHTIAESMQASFIKRGWHRVLVLRPKKEADDARS